MDLEYRRTTALHSRPIVPQARLAAGMSGVPTLPPSETQFVEKTRDRIVDAADVVWYSY